MSQRTFLSEIFACEWLGLRAIDERFREVLYGPVSLGYLDTHWHVLHRALRPDLRRNLAPLKIRKAALGNRPRRFPHSHPAYDG